MSGKKHELVLGFSFTNSEEEEDTGYRTTRSISISEKTGEQRPIPGNRRKGSGADTNENIQEVWCTETDIGPLKTIQPSIRHHLAWLDDASRLALAGGEFERATHGESIEKFKEAQTKALEFNILIREVNTVRYSRFYSNKNPGTSAFEQYLKEEGIRHAPSRKGNPQTNGKLERLWREYDRHRWRFEAIEAFLSGYNNRIHGALDYINGETPEEAFLRRAPPEAILGKFLKGND